MTTVADDPNLPEDGLEEPLPPVGHIRVVYLGPVAPHWDVQSDYGDATLIEEFTKRTHARLVLLPPHDPQYRRNRERVIRDAERENLVLEWDLGEPEEEVVETVIVVGDESGTVTEIIEDVTVVDEHGALTEVIIDEVIVTDASGEVVEVAVEETVITEE